MRYKFHNYYNRYKRYLLRLWKIVNRREALIALAALPALAIWGFLAYRFIVTPRPAKIREASAKSQYYFEGKNSLYSARIGDKKTNEPKVEFTIPKTDKSVVFYPASARTGLAKPEIEGKQIIFKNVYQDTDYIYQTTAYGIKEDIKINKPNGISIYPFYIEPKNVTPRYFAENLAGGVFYDENKNYLFHFEKPFAIDAKGARTQKAEITIKKDSQNGKLVAILNIDKDWLASPDRAYPITIDPTIVHDTTAEFATGQMNRVKDTGPGATATLESYYQELPADQYTVGLWHMNEGTDNTCSGGQDACDSSGNGLHGTDSGGSTIVTGRLGNARNLDGTDDFLTVADNDKLSFGNNTMSAEAWIKRSGIPAGNEYVILKGVTTWEYQLLILTGGTVYAVLYQSGGAGVATVTSVSNVTDGNWHHVAMVSNGVKLTIYVDGREDNSTTSFTGTMSNTAASLYFGDRSDIANSEFQGQIDEIRLSNIARTPEEIKLAAQRRPYSVYTSDVIDFTSNIISWNPLTWSEHGVATGDGETLKDSTSLVAQWNLNSTSGTTATNDAGSCGATCNGTLTSFASTGSQDAAAGTGWTANNKRWGAGALMFDGTNDYVRVPYSSALNITSSISLEAWIKTNQTSRGDIIERWQLASPNPGYGMNINSTDAAANAGRIGCWVGDNTAGYLNSNKTVNDGQWHHVSCTLSGTTVSLYIDGRLDTSGTRTPSMNETSTALSIGAIPDTGTTYRFNGIIDTPRLYSRALGASEIMSNYQAGNVELLTRVGADTSPDDGSWEAWRPTTGETAIDSFDGPYQYNTTDSGLVSYWPMDETVNDSCSGGQDACDVKTTNHGTATGTKIVDAKYGKGRDFNGTSDNISIANESNFDFSSIVTLEAWFKADSTSARKIISKGDGSNEEYEMDINGWTSGNVECGYFTNNVNYRYEGSPFVVGKWHHAVCVLDSTQSAAADKVKLYLDGVEKTSPTVNTLGTIGSIGLNNYPVTIGTRSGASPVFFDGAIDEVRIYNSVLSASTIQQHYVEGTTKPETFHPMTDSTYKIEGSASQKIETGRPTIDGATAALWHLDETGGTGAYLKDSTINANNGTPTGTTVSNGVSNKARTFASGNRINVTSNAGLNLANNFSFESWVKLGAAATTHYIASKYPNTTTGWIFFRHTDNKFYVQGGNGVTWPGAFNCSTTGTWTDSNWHHVAFTVGSSVSIYVDGVAVLSGCTRSADVATNTTDFVLGGWDTTSGFIGTIDEARYSNVARSAEEIAEAYRAGRDHYINKTISSTDLSSKTSLPFYVAADRPGTYLQATIGESAFANYLPDANTKALIHLDEQSGSGAYIKDASGNSNHGTPTGASYSQGKIGKGRYFDNSNDVIDLGSDASLDFGNNGAFTHSGWINPATLGDYDAFVSKVVAARNGVYSYMTVFMANGRLSAYTGAAWVDICPAGSVTTGRWQHVAFDYNGTNISGYVNGALCGSVAFTYTDTATHNVFIGSWYVTTQLYDFNGVIDEVTISNSARTADEIRQAYEVGLRTHPVTVDFGAKLDSGDLISGSSDLGFTVDATYYGLQNKGDMLFKGDKIIVRENYDGTEYIAQGTIDSINASTGSASVSAWDASSTFPSGGFTVNASVFKWQREYWSVNNEALDSHIDAVTNLTLRLTDGAEGRTIWLDDLKSSGGYLTTPGGSTITSSTGNRYFQYRIVNTSFDEAVTATVSAVTVDYVINTAPNTPTLNEPTDTATNQSLTPRLKTTATDADSDYIRYKIEMCTNALMTLNCQTFDQTSSQTGWSGQNTESSTAYTSGTQGVYSVQTPLTALTTYYWRSYAIDPGGINTWSSTQGTPFSFTTSNNPLPPSSLLAEGVVNPIVVTDTTPEFSAICNHEGAAVVFNKYRIQVALSADFASPVWDSGASGTAMTDCVNGTRSQDISYGGTPLALDGTVYYWRIDFWDTFGNESPWSTESTFFKMDSSVLEAPTNCRIQEGVDEASITLLWDDNSTTETQFRIEKDTNSGGFTFLINKVADSESHLDSSVSQGNTYQYRVRAEGATNSDWCTTSMVTLQLGTFQFKGLDLKGLNLQ